MSFQDGSALIVGTFVAVSNSEGDGNPAPVRLRGFIINYRRFVNVRTHSCYNCFSVLFFHEFSTRGGGEVPTSSEACNEMEPPVPKRGVPSLHLYREDDGRTPI